MTVSPGPGKREPRMTRSVLIDPTTMMREFCGMPSSLNDKGGAVKSSRLEYVLEFRLSVARNRQILESFQNFWGVRSSYWVEIRVVPPCAQRFCVKIASSRRL